MQRRQKTWNIRNWTPRAICNAGATVRMCGISLKISLANLPCCSLQLGSVVVILLLAGGVLNR